MLHRVDRESPLEGGVLDSQWEKGEGVWVGIAAALTVGAGVEDHEVRPADARALALPAERRRGVVARRRNCTMNRPPAGRLIYIVDTHDQPRLDQ